MRWSRPLGALFAAALTLLLPAGVLAADATDIEGLVFAIHDDAALAPGETADAVIVIDGVATVEGTTRALVVIDGDATVTGPTANVEDIFAVGGSVTIGPGAQVEDIAWLDTQVTISPDATVTGTSHDIRSDLLWIAGAFGLAVLLIWVGAGLATLVAGLAMAGLASTQVRRAGATIGREPFKVLGVGLLMMILPLVVSVLLAITVVGIPLAIGLLVAWGLVAYLGYLVAGIWIGDHLLPVRDGVPRRRPYAASILGLLILLVGGIIPIVTFVASWFGLGAVTLAGWRVLRAKDAIAPDAGAVGSPWPTPDAPIPYPVGQVPVGGSWPPYGQSPTPWGTPPQGQPPAVPGQWGAPPQGQPPVPPGPPPAAYPPGPPGWGAPGQDQGASGGG